MCRNSRKCAARLLRETTSSRGAKDNTTGSSTGNRPRRPRVFHCYRRSSIFGPQKITLPPAGEDQGKLKTTVDLVAQKAHVDVHDVGVLLHVIIEVLQDHR